MKKLSSTISHMAVIGLALLALVVATMAWWFERMRGDDFSRPSEPPEVDLISVLESETLERRSPLTCDEKANGNVSASSLSASSPEGIGKLIDSGPQAL